MPAMTVHGCRPAMGTLFEAWLVGEDEEHLSAVVEAIFDEVVRLERLLSRFDPRSEIARVNRLAAEQAVQVDHEVFGILQTCGDYWQQTGGYYDVAATQLRAAPSVFDSRASFADVVLDAERHTVRFTNPAVMIDLGGFGKGYALDAAAEILVGFGIEHAFLHGGTSSALARGRNQQHQPWLLGVRNPWSQESARELRQLPLSDRAYSCSARRRPANMFPIWSIPRPAVLSYSKPPVSCWRPRRSWPRSSRRHCCAWASSGPGLILKNRQSPA